MDIRKVADDFAVAPQIPLDAVGAIAEAGFKTVIVNRPDGEDPGQPDMAAMRAAVEAAGMTFVAIPITSGQFTPEAIVETQDALAASDGPTLAYCRSGTRSVTLWALAQAPSTGAEAVIAAAGGAGYDLSPLRPYLERG